MAEIVSDEPRNRRHKGQWFKATYIVARSYENVSKFVNWAKVEAKTYQMAIASLEGFVDSLTDLAGGRLPGAESQLTRFIVRRIQRQFQRSDLRDLSTSVELDSLAERHYEYGIMGRGKDGVRKYMRKRRRNLGSRGCGASNNQRRDRGVHIQTIHFEVAIPRLPLLLCTPGADPTGNRSAFLQLYSSEGSTRSNHIYSRQFFNQGTMSCSNSASHRVMKPEAE